MVQQQPPWPLPRWAGLQLCRFQGQRGSSQDHSLRGAVAVLVEHGMHCLAMEERGSGGGAHGLRVPEQRLTLCHCQNGG